MRSFAIIALALTTSVMATPALAASCYDLWYQRNVIFDNNGFCFTTSLGRRVFDNSDCYTSNPELSNSERRRVAQIRRQERRQGCRVN
jgi:hypothetical protein